MLVSINSESCGLPFVVLFSAVQSVVCSKRSWVHSVFRSFVPSGVCWTDYLIIDSVILRSLRFLLFALSMLLVGLHVYS